MTFGNMRTHTPKPLRVFVQQEGARFRVVYQRQYPQTVEEAVYSERFKTPEEAQKFIETRCVPSASTAICKMAC
jgi:hypothetical protein